VFTLPKLNHKFLSINTPECSFKEWQVNTELSTLNNLLLTEQILLEVLTKERPAPSILEYQFLVASQKVLPKLELKLPLFMFHHPSQLMLFLKLLRLKFHLLFALLKVSQLSIWSRLNLLWTLNLRLDFWDQTAQVLLSQVSAKLVLCQDIFINKVISVLFPDPELWPMKLSTKLPLKISDNQQLSELVVIHSTVPTLLMFLNASSLIQKLKVSFSLEKSVEKLRNKPLNGFPLTTQETSQ